MYFKNKYVKELLHLVFSFCDFYLIFLTCTWSNLIVFTDNMIGFVWCTPCYLK